MKRFLTILILSFITLFANAQVYTSIKYLDKFDDEVKVENIKTIVEKTDSTFIVETKGKDPVTYYILNVLEYTGNKDNIVNLVANVYGYQTCWCVVRSDMAEDYGETYYNVLISCLKIRNSEELTDSEKEKLQKLELSKLEKYYLFITHRVIVSQYSHTYETEYFWVQDETNTRLGKDINRIIYIKN